MKMNLFLLGAFIVCTYADGSLDSTIEEIVNNWTTKAVMSISVGVALPNGTKTFSSGNHLNGDTTSGNTTPSDPFVYGSLAKMFTAAAVLRLVDSGKIKHLDVKALPLMDKFWQSINGTSLVDDLGPQIKNVTLRQLLGMRAGIADFDTWTMRDYQLARPLEDMDPVLSLSFLQKGNAFHYAPGAGGEYSSTNYVLLGAVLAQAAGASAWDKYTQRPDLPDDVLNDMPHTSFALHGACQRYSPLHGESTSMQYRVDAYNMSCTNGWTCGNLVSNAGDAAYFVRALLGKGERVVSAKMQQQMLNFSEFTQGWSSGLRYGLGVMDMRKWTQQHNVSFLGHGGDTYGFSSLTGYIDDRDVGISVVINSEQKIVVEDVMSEVFAAVVQKIAPASSFMLV